MKQRTSTHYRTTLWLCIYQLLQEFGVLRLCLPSIRSACPLAMAWKLDLTAESTQAPPRAQPRPRRQRQRPQQASGSDMDSVGRGSDRSRSDRGAGNSAPQSSAESVNELGEPKRLDMSGDDRPAPRFVRAGEPTGTTTAPKASARKPRKSGKKDDKVPSGGGSGRRGERERRQLARIDAMKISKEQAALMTVVVKSSLWAQQSLRDMMGALYDTYMLETESDEVVRMRLAGQAYSQAVRTSGKGHPHGPPACHFFGGLMESLLKRGSALGQQTFLLLQALAAIMDDIMVEEVFLAVRHCRLSKVYDKTKTRLAFVLFQAPITAWVTDKIEAARADTYNEDLQAALPVLLKLQNSCVRSLLRKAIIETGARHLTGRAPQGALEELLQSSVEGKK